MKVYRTLKVYAKRYEVGDIIRFKLTTGEKVELLAVEQKDDCMQFVFNDCLMDEYPMNDSYTNEGGYLNSKLRKTLNEEIIKLFPKKILKKMRPFHTGDYLTIPSEKEIFGTNEYGESEPDSVKQWEPMKLRKNRIASQGLNGIYEWYFLRNRSVRSGSVFAYVDNDGGANCHGASYASGVRPSLLIYNP